MKKIGMILSAAVACLSLPNAVRAQDNKVKLELGYNVSAPLGDFKNNYISNTSFKGFYGELSYAFNPKFSLGLNVGYQNYYQKYGREVYKVGNQTVSAVVSNNMEVTPLLVRGTFYPLGGSASVQPYVSAGAGVNLVSYGQYLGEFGDTQASSPFAAQAGAGVMIPFGKSVGQSGIKLGATYNYSHYNKNNISNLNTVGGNVGVVFALK